MNLFFADGAASLRDSYNANMLITQREGVSRNIREALAERAKEFKIHLDDVSITDLTFGHEYAAAVESKQIAQQNAQRAVLVVERAIQEKQQKIVEAEGEAASAALIGKAIAENPGFLNLRKIEAAREIASIVRARPPRCPCSSCGWDMLTNAYLLCPNRCRSRRTASSLTPTTCSSTCSRASTRTLLWFLRCCCLVFCAWFCADSLLGGMVCLSQGLARRAQEEVISLSH